MSLDQARQFADQAAQCLQAGQPGLALDLAEQALLLQPGMPDAENLRGVALSQSGQPRAAEEAFLRSAAALKTSAKPLYNLAVHFYGLGRKQDALDWTARALEREPDHALAFALQSLIRDGSPALQVSNRNPYALELEATLEDGEYRFEWMRESRAGWLAVGWILAAMNLVALAIVVSSNASSFDESVPWYLFWLFLGSYGLGIAYIAVDVVGRSRSRFWIAAMAVTGCFLAWLALPIYLVTGRKPKR